MTYGVFWWSGLQAVYNFIQFNNLQ
jgi:hypothetical protein